MAGMFCKCLRFNQDLSSWDVRNVKYKSNMFYFDENMFNYGHPLPKEKQPKFPK